MLPNRLFLASRHGSSRVDGQGQTSGDAFTCLQGSQPGASLDTLGLRLGMRAVGEV